MIHAYLFEARGIQRYLFATGKLRDVLAGSELLDQVCVPGGFLDIALAVLDLRPTIPRRAGGTFYLLFDGAEDAKRFRAAWRLAIARWIPGVETVDALVSSETAREAISDGVALLRRHRNVLGPSLPRPGPLDARSPRTGYGATTKRDGEHLDEATSRAREFARLEGSSRLEQRFLTSGEFAWPRSFEQSGRDGRQFPLNRDRLIGVVHADGNEIGKMLRVLGQASRQLPDSDYVDLYREFSDGLTAATQASAQEATEHALLPHATDGVIPARPLVLGGDDVTLLVRADLAVPFTTRYLVAFEAHTQALMKTLKEHLGASGRGEDTSKLPDHLTASAGIAYCKSSFPFLSAYEVSEGLASRAKHASRSAGSGGESPASTIAFHKMEGAVAESADALHMRFHQVVEGGTTYHLALPAYAIRQHPVLPSIGQLEDLAAPFQEGRDRLNDRPLRELATLWRQDPAVARGAYSRWRQVASRDVPDALAHFDAALHAIVGETEGSLPTGRGEPRLSPLSDLLVWLSLHGTDTDSGGEIA